MHTHRALLTESDVRIAAGLGGTVDFLAGKVVRAPVFLRKLGLEWAYRLYQEPSRWKRQLVLPGFALRGLLPGCVAKVHQRPVIGARRPAPFGR
jgi:UDP-N-acetyl-D-mannosaminuronic acid transferase (WecB/TagA/CpsF family)